MVESIARICDAHGIRYFLHAGSALGAVRHGGPIPWDYDTDILIPEKDIGRFILAMEAELPEKFSVDTHRKNPTTTAMFPRVGLKGYSTEVLHVDCFRMIGLPEDREGQQKLLKRASLLRKCYRAKAQGWNKGNLKSKVLKALLLPVSRGTIARRFDRLCNAVPFDEAKYVGNPFGKYGMKNVFKKEVYGEGIMVPYGGLQVRIARETDFYLRQYYGDYMRLPDEKTRAADMERTYIVEEVSEKHV